MLLERRKDSGDGTDTDSGNGFDLSLPYFRVSFDDIVDRSFYAIYCAKNKGKLFVKFVKFFIISLFFYAIYCAIVYANYCAKVGDVTGTLNGDTDTAAVLFEDRIRKFAGPPAMDTWGAVGIVDTVWLQLPPRSMVFLLPADIEGGTVHFFV